MEARRRWLGVLVLAMVAVAPASVLARAEGDAGPSVFVGAGGGFLFAPVLVLEAHAGAGWRTPNNLIAAMLSASWANHEAILGDWSTDRRMLAAGLFGAHWFGRSWHVDAFAVAGPSIRRYEDPTTSRSANAFAWSAGLGGGWKGLGLHVGYVGAPDSICFMAFAGGTGCWATPSGFQAVVTGTFDVFQIR